MTGNVLRHRGCLATSENVETAWLRGGNVPAVLRCPAHGPGRSVGALPPRGEWTKEWDARTAGSGSNKKVLGMWSLILLALTYSGHQTPAAGSGPVSFGSTLCEIGDLDSNGSAEILVGAPWESGGRVLVLDPRDGNVLREHAGEAGDGQFGSALLAAGDLDGDGLPEYIIGSAGQSDLSASATASVYSSQGELLRRHTLCVGGALWRGGPRLGMTPVMCSTGDVDLDGTPDYAVASKEVSGENSGKGVVRVYSGATGEAVREVYGKPGLPFGQALGSGAISGLTGVPDLLVSSVPDLHLPGARHASSEVTLYSMQEGGRMIRRHVPTGSSCGYGFALCVLADLDGDGCREYAVSQPYTIPSEQEPIMVYSGQSGRAVWKWSGEGSEGLFGAILVPWNGGRGILVSSPAGNTPGLQLFEHGRESSVLRIDPPRLHMELNYGASVCVLEGYDADKAASVAVGAPCYYENAACDSLLFIQSCASGEMTNVFTGAGRTEIPNSDGEENTGR
jgi:hypothetical protein